MHSRLRQTDQGTQAAYPDRYTGSGTGTKSHSCQRTLHSGFACCWWRLPLIGSCGADLRGRGLYGIAVGLVDCYNPGALY